MSKKKILVTCGICVMVLAILALGTYLLLRHVHTYDWVTITVPSCTDPGLEGLKCVGEKGCGKIVETKEIQLLGHLPSDEWQISIPATCDSEGSETLICQRCGNLIDSRSTKILEHIANTEWSIVKEPTCTETGKEAILCSLCNNFIFEERIIEKLGHEYPKEWSTITEPTCTQNGTKEVLCLRCNNKKTDIIFQLGHKYSAWETLKKATCTDDGSQKRTCTVCGAVQNKVVKPSGHDYSEPVIKSTPGCTTVGISESVCRSCGDVLSYETQPTGHNIVWSTTIEPTYFETGSRFGTCSKCGAGFLEDIPKLTIPRGKVGETIKISVFAAKELFGSLEHMDVDFKILSEDEYGVQTLKILDDSLRFENIEHTEGNYYWYNGFLSKVEETINHICNHNALLMNFNTVDYSNTAPNVDYFSEFLHHEQLFASCSVCGASLHVYEGQIAPSSIKYETATNNYSSSFEHTNHYVFFRPTVTEKYYKDDCIMYDHSDNTVSFIIYYPNICFFTTLSLEMGRTGTTGNYVIERIRICNKIDEWRTIYKKVVSPEDLDSTLKDIYNKDKNVSFD